MRNSAWIIAKRSAAVIAIAAAALTATSFSARAQNYTYINIDNPGASYNATQAGSPNFFPQGSAAQGINNTGQITGVSYDFTGHATAYSQIGGSYTTLPDPGSSGSGTYGLGINNAGQIVGSYNGGGTFGFLSNSPYTSTTTINVPGTAATFAQGINDSGNIVGYYSNTGPDAHGFVSSSPYSSFTTIDAPGANNVTVTSGINNSNQVAGFFVDINNIYNGFISSAPYSSFTAIADPNAGTNPTLAATIFQGTVAYALNNVGQVVGDFFDSLGNLNAFLYNGLTYATINDPLGVNGTDAFSINDLGQVVGDYIDANGIFHAYLADPNTVNYTAPSGAPGSGNAGQSFAATDAAAGSGATQIISGGNGGSLAGGGQAGAGGNGSSTLTPANGVTNGTATGNGGAGGNGSTGTQGGNGGNGTGSATFTGTGDVTANANGNGGNGGNNTDHTAPGGNGGNGQSTASATTSSVGNTALANSTATGGMGGTGSSNGAGGTAQATATATNNGGGTANANANATAYANTATALANGSGGSGTVTAQSTTYPTSTGGLPSVQGFATAPIDAPAAAETATSVGGPVEQLLTPYTSLASVPGSANAYVAANLSPTNASLATTYATYSAANTAFNNTHAHVVGSAVLSVASGQTFATPQTYSTTVQFNDMVSNLNGNGIVATILGGQSFGSNIGTVEFYFTESYNGGGSVKVDDQTYASLSAALAALENHTFILGDLPGGVSGDFYVTANLDLTTLAANGIELNMLFGNVPEPSTWLLFGSGLLGMAFFQRRRREDLLALLRRGFNAAHRGAA